MQTFLPYKSFIRSAGVLDQQRLGKQRVETMQIMRALCEGRGWVNHPATLMWKGYENHLMAYQVAVVNQWLARGYKDTCLEKTQAIWEAAGEPGQDAAPPWLGNRRFHAAMMSRLIQKDPEFYGSIFPASVPRDLDYVWPTKEGLMTLPPSNRDGE